LDASVIDYPRASLDPALFDEDHMVSEVREEVLDIVGAFLDHFELSDDTLVDVLIYGSILTNQWNPHTDVDGRIVLSKDIVNERYPDITGDDLFDETSDMIHDVLIGATDHPLNLTVIIEGDDTLLGKAPLGGTEFDPVYDVLNDEMIVPPTHSDLDPDETFSEDKDQVKVIMDGLDDLIRETKMDVVDYQTLKDAVKNVSDSDKLLKRLQQKLDEIEQDLSDVSDEYDELKDKRTEALTENPEDDWRESRHWAPGNVQYKYLERYRYIDILKKLKHIFKGGVQKSEVKDLEKILNVEGQLEDINAPTEINMNEVVRSCPWCGYASKKPPMYVQGESCPKCGFLSQPYGGEYSAWVYACLKRAGCTPAQASVILE